MQRISTPTAVHSRQGGAVIIVVVSLMAALAFLGFFFFTFADQEQSNARNYASAESYAIDPDPVFDFALQQYIVSTPDDYADSVLHGNKWSLLANLLGTMNPDGSPTDVHPHSGTGILFEAQDTNGDGLPDDSDSNFVPDAFNLQYVDPRTGTTETRQFQDGGTGTVTSNWVLNFSRVAHGGANDAFNLSANAIPDFDPDAGYTYPDINSPFLGLDQIDPASGERLIKPSFMLPGLFDRTSYAGLYMNPDYKAQVMRPHQSHLNSDGSARFLSTPRQAQSGDRNRVIQPMDFMLARMGLWDGGDSNYDLDVDADNDGINDAILMDLDHPIIDLPGGRQVVPLFAPKIIDAQGLLNVNIHGNLNGIIWDASPSFAHPVGGGESAHVSNLGLSPSEVNPIWALDALPGDSADLASADIPYAMRDHEANFGFNAATFYAGAASNRGKRITTANMELAFLLCGRANADGGPQVAGRWTDAGMSVDFAGGNIPGPGATGVDDDLDDVTSVASAGRNPYGGYPFDSELLAGLRVPPYVHPLDFLGIGGDYLRDAGTGAVRVRDSALSNNPTRWLTYGDAWQDQGVLAPYGVMTYQGAVPMASPPPQAGSPAGTLIDEDDEVVLEPAFPQSDDAIFGPQEMAGLHLSDADWHGVGMESRLRQLLPVNFEYSRRAADIRERFTTDSWSRLEFALGAGIRNWEFNDNDGSTVRFPPSFGSVGASRHETDPLNPVPEDPFRPVVRRLLTIRYDSLQPDRSFPQQRLDINRLLVNFDPYGNPIYRHLTPHPVFEGTETDSNRYLVDGSGAVRPMYHGNPTYPHNYYVPNTDTLDFLDPDIPAEGTYSAVPLSAVASDKFAQEMWARYDRQRLARDIYVLLYVLGCNGTFDPTAAPYPVNPTTDVNGNGVNDLLEQAAQFAVNYVDALDRDSVITRFEYDTNLVDGWNNPAEVVYGVEDQMLTFSEVMVIRAKGDTGAGAADDPRTLHDDTIADENRWLYIELRNTSPFPVPLKTGSWRIVRTAPDDHTPVAAVEFESTGSPNDRVVGPGANFLIATHDGSVINGAGQNIGADFFADFADFSGGADPDQLEMFVPHHNNVTAIADNNERPTPHAHLDLAFDDSSHLDYYSRNPAGARLINAETGGTNAFVAFDLVLQRRQNLGSANLIGGDSEWVEVDRVRIDEVDTKVFDITPSSGNASRAEVRDQLLGTAMETGVFSLERPQPFLVDKSIYPKMTPHSARGTYPTHSFERAVVDPDSNLSAEPDRDKKNDALAGSEFAGWQPHFNRDFSSIYELLAIPLYGYTDTVEPDPFSPLDHGGPVYNLLDGGKLSGHRAAAALFLNPDNGTTMGAGAGDDDNAWYRLFEFITVSPRTQQAIAPVHDTPGSSTRPEVRIVRRTPGKINLNMIRHEGVLAGLIDDPFHLDPFGPDTVDATQLAMTDDSYNGDQNWFGALRATRDGWDGSSIRLPGTPFARPFRPLSYDDPNASTPNLEHSILRNRPGTDLTLFEARANTDIATNDVDYHTRNRLLAKIANNSTVSSNVFAMWLVIQFHEAHEPSPGIVQIGAKAEGLPVYRLFCVIDRSRLEEAYDPESGTFDFRKFIIHRQLLP